MVNNEYRQKIARILRVPQSTLVRLEEALDASTGKAGVLEKLAIQNEELINKKLIELSLKRDSKSHEVFDSLISKVEADDLALLNIIGHSNLRGYEASQKVCQFVRDIHPAPTGFFLKKEKARELLMAEPPKKIMKALGYSKVEDLLEKEDLLEVYSALRFLEDREWQNKIFFKQYESLVPSDFERRPLEIRALNEKWAEAAEKFVAKKYHNVSHLKELGVIFVIPVFLGISGETLRLLSLLLHYVNEIKYYSDIFYHNFAPNEKAFAANLISALRGDVIEHRIPEPIAEAQRPNILVIQRYLAKDDENDWRLFEPHINPEALHWQRAENEIVKINPSLAFWSGLGWTGNFFKSEAGVDILISFNLVDTVMALVKQKELIKYLYHHQEALWNKIFSEYFSIEELEKLSKDYIVKGWFEV